MAFPSPIAMGEGQGEGSPHSPRAHSASPLSPIAMGEPYSRPLRPPYHLLCIAYRWTCHEFTGIR